MGFWDGIDEAGVGNGYTYFAAGTFRVRIDEVTKKEKTESFKGKNSFIVNTTVQRSTNPQVPVGSSPCWVQTIKDGSDAPSEQQRKLAFRSINEFLTAALGGDVAASFAEVGGLVTSPANPLEGKIVDVVCSEKKTKNGSTFTEHRWYPVA